MTGGSDGKLVLFLRKLVFLLMRQLFTDGSLFSYNKLLVALLENGFSK